MNNLLSNLPFFVEVARQKSFTLAADALDMPISTLSRRISAMEKELGVRLFRRNTRKVELTEGGADFFERCNYILGAMESARDSLMRDMKQPSGPVRLAMPMDVYHAFLEGVFSDFALQYPDIRMEVTFTNRWVDLMTEPFDLDIRVGELPDSNLRARRLYSVTHGVYASPKLLEFYPEPQVPEDLKKMPCIGMHVSSGGWELNRDGEERRIPLNFIHYLNGGGLMAEFLLAGIGASLAPPSMMKAFEKYNMVKRLLPEWTGPVTDLHLVMPEGQLPHRVRLFADYLAAHFSSPETGPLDLEPYILAELKKK